MHFHRVGSIFVVAIVAAATAFAGNSGVVQVSGNTYSVFREAKNTFHRDTQVLQDAAVQEAEAYCKANGRQMKIVTWDVYKPRFISGYASAKLVFKALAPGEEEAPAPVTAAAPTLPADAIASGSNDFYTVILKLDDLRKRGIISEKEFETQKKKAFKRAQ